MITVMGEALIDLAPTADAAVLRAVPAGSGLNVAVSAARLGYPVTLMTHLSRDPFGDMLRRYALQNGVDLSGATEGDEPTAIAIEPADGRRMRAILHSRDASAWPWTPTDLALIPADTAVLHICSLVWCTAASATRALRAAGRLRQRGALVSMDLTVHPEAMRTPGQGRILLERPLRSADVALVSIADINWLYPGRTPQAVAEQLLRLGPRLVIVACGPSGAMAIREPGIVVHRPAYPADVVDTTGAREAFTAALLVALHTHHPKDGGVRSLTTGPLTEMLDLAVLVAGITCERPGSDTPTAAELRERCRLTVPARAPCPAIDGTLTIPRRYFRFVNGPAPTLLLVPA
jgi:fructokinase